MIWSTDPHIFAGLHGDDHALGIRHLGKQWQAERGVFSHSLGLAAWQEDMLAGLAIGFHVAEQTAHVEPFLKLAAEVMTESELATMDTWWGTYGQFNLPAIPEDAWYLQNLAVDSAMRGHGIGAELLRRCMDRARSEGFRRLHLDVYDGNPAVGLYRRLGFAVIVETRVLPQMAKGAPMHLRMEALL